MEQPRNRRDFNSTIVCSAFPQKLTEVAQKFYRSIRAIISSVYPAIVRLSRGTSSNLRLSQLLFIRSIYAFPSVISFRGCFAWNLADFSFLFFSFLFFFFLENVSQCFKKKREEKKRKGKK